MTRSLALLTTTLLFALTACPGATPEDNDGGPKTDMRTTDGDDGEVDLASVEPQRCKGKGCIGAPCTQASDCTEGKAGAPKLCWVKTILENPRYVPTPDGYCSQECASDADCGTGYCLRLPNEAKSYCMARCRTANTCRHPGYACAFEAGAGEDGICFPDANMKCQPTVGTCEAIVDVAGTKYKGGCIRAAYEDKGICHVACQVGKGTCPLDYKEGGGTPAPQHCIYLDTTVDTAGRPSPYGDKWKGAVCWEYEQKQIAPGEKCAYWDECQDGYQCDRLATPESKQVCRQLCAQGNGVQDSSGIFVPMGATVFTNTCLNVAEGCANALQSGVGNGKIGLCSPK